MKVIILGDPSSAHIIKWANEIDSRGIRVLVFGLTPINPTAYNKRIEIEIFKIPEYIKWQSDGNFLKTSYLLSIPRLKKIIKKFKCDILHAHSASSYGLLGALSKFHPYIISVWGNDVYIFPQKNTLYRKLLMHNFLEAEMITSTSRTMANFTKQFTDKKIFVIPFGVALDKFKPKPRGIELYNETDIVIGTIKSMEKKYGSEDILEAFNILKNNYPVLPLKLLLVGRGSLISRLEKKSKEYGLVDSVKITGLIPFDEIPRYYNLLDIYLAPSTEESESFGVSVLEASACGKPVIVSNIGGLPEVVVDNHTGFIIPHNNPTVLASTIEKLILNKHLRFLMGKNGRKFVEEVYDIKKISNTIIASYHSLTGNKNGLVCETL